MSAPVTEPEVKLRIVDRRAFGRHVRQLRRARGQTQETLAEDAQLSADTIRRLEHGSFSPSLETLGKICEGLSLQLSTLFIGFELDSRDIDREIADALAGLSNRQRETVLKIAWQFRKFVTGRPEQRPDSEPR